MSRTRNLYGSNDNLLELIVTNNRVAYFLCGKGKLILLIHFRRVVVCRFVKEDLAGSDGH
jgi:hypothetical protein